MINGSPRLKSPGLVPAQNFRLFGLSDACLAGADGFVWLPSRRSGVAESVSQYFDSASDHPQMCSPRFPKPRELAGVAISLVTPAGGGFHHFLLESLSRLSLASRFRGIADHFLINGGDNSFHRSWLEAAGLDLKKVIFVNDLSHFSCEHLLFTSAPSLPGSPSKWMVDAVTGVFEDRIACKTDCDKVRKIWISRKDAATRQIGWEIDLLRELDDFEFLSCASLSPSEQIQAFRNAKVIAGPHGAGLTNMIFAEAGATVIEFAEKTQPHIQVFSRLAAVCGHRHSVYPVDFQSVKSLREVAATMRGFADDVLNPSQCQ